MQFLGGLRILCIPEHDKVCVVGKESHLTFRIATVGAVRVGLDELANCKAIRGFFGRDSYVLAHWLVSLGLNDGSGFEKSFDPVSAVFAPAAGVFESSPRRVGIVRHSVDHHPSGSYL